MHTLSRRAALSYSAAALAVTGAAPLFGHVKPDGTTEHHVSIKDMKFDPPTVELKVGDSVSWKNLDLVNHTATSAKAGWSTGVLKKGDAESLVITAEMAGAYVCKYHPQMKGMLVIVS
ncbi:cupredoxin domain-containing protein [Cypionkella psychrotolerans]|uniref:cupredoxin domain-containing protein n=1 Tax=Cypionkella psychrotolerans TaxID=1678131 RepID=UPI0006B6433C|nr:cupredoxin domain-containing protein [Cypionkella psychrotolerans]